MTLGEVVNARNAIAALGGAKVPTRLAYKFMTFLKQTENDTNFFEERKRDVIEEFCSRDENGNLIVDDKGNYPIISGKDEEASSAIQELEAIEVAPPLAHFYLGELEQIELDMGQMEALYPFIEADGEVELVKK